MFRRGSGRDDPSAGGRRDVGARAERDLGRVVESADSVLAGIDDAFEAALRLEQEAYADALVEEAERAATFRDRLLRLRHGRPVRIHLISGAVITGRVGAVGSDWFGLRCADGPGGLGVGRTWELRFAAVAGLETGGEERR